jgi:transposase
MFVRKKKNRSGSISVQIIDKSYGTYRVLKTVGSSRDESEVERLYQEAIEEIPHMFNQLTLSLFDQEKAQQNHSVEDLSNDDIRVIGPELVLGRIFDRIGFNQIPEPLFRDLVISRITHPGSKLKVAEYLRENKGQEISVYSIYRYMDKISNMYKEKVEQISFHHTKRVLKNKISIVFYDMTTIYFESSEEDDLRVRGYSKDGKHHLPQIYIGLLVGVKGYPIGYDIFEGNIFEGHTLIPVLEHFQEKFKLSKPVVIADAGLLSKENIAGLKEKGYQYILGAKPKNEAEELKGKIIELEWKDEQTAEFARNDSSRLIIGYSSKRAKKDEDNRKRGLKRLEKNLKAGKLTKGQINNRGYNKYLRLTGDITVEIDYDKYNADGKWDGLKGYVTNTDLFHQDVIANYNQLWHIEKAFRISKTDLKIRPVHHRLPNRIATHICISFVAYTIYKEMERLLYLKAPDISMNKAIEATKKMYQVMVENSDKSKKIIELKKNQIQQKIVSIIENPD